MADSGGGARRTRGDTPMSERTREDHLAWCKARALTELNAPGQTDEQACQNAFASMSSDLRKHEETAQHVGIELGFMLMFSGQKERCDREAMRKFIEGFN